ncbi:VWA domain-containing protein [Aliamphritea ceti]|uniref:VWA domain-containing protein n=1 Tax=Aliamphritea ceti TaxID=1524258 RepID=UPI0021C34483|nr:VWA domain-containing protein [Aliamphritea ceti]
MLAEFHFIRPLWLLLLPVIPALLFGLWQIQSARVSWQTLIAPGLRDYLIDGQSGRLSTRVFVALGIGWLLGILALAGPAWERLPQPVYQTGDAMVIVMDLSPSMMARDVAPSRLERMRYKLTDLIKARDEGMTALVVYAGDSHVLAPLSDDQQTLLALLPGLSPAIMPIQGSHTEEAVALALELLRQDKRQQGSLVLLTDGVTAQAASAIGQLFNELPAGTDFTLSVMGIGTAEGAPIPLAEGFAKDAAGKIVVARLDAGRLSKLATDTGGIYTPMRLDNSDIEGLITAASDFLPTDTDDSHTKALEQTFDQWQEAGSWLVLLMLPLAALAFRRGWLLTVLFVLALPVAQSPPVYAAEVAEDKVGSRWQSLWQTQDQQAAEALTQGDNATAAELFQHPDWQATARYRNGDFTAAAEQFAAAGDAEGLYNSGNALAKAGKLNEALDAYKQVLEQQPQHEDAQANKDLIEELIKQQQNQQSQSQQSDSQQDQSQQDKSPEDQNKQGQNQQDQNQQGQNQQDQNQQGQNQQDQNQQGQSESDNSESEQSQSEQSQQDQAEQLRQQLEQQQQEALDKQQAQAEQQADSAEEGSQDEQQSAAQQVTQSQPEQTDEEAALQKWLGQLPEDPTGLLRNKFDYEYQKKRQAYQNGDWQPAQEQRW